MLYVKKSLAGLLLLALGSTAFAADYTFYTRGPIVNWVIVDGVVVKSATGNTFNSPQDAVSEATIRKLECPKCRVYVHTEDYEITSTRVTVTGVTSSSSNSSSASSVK